MKKMALFFVVVFVFVLLPVWASAAIVEGSVQGYGCVVKVTVCPIGKEDPHVAVERVFVVLTGDKDYYFVPNVDRATLARHVNEMVRITGKLSSKYKSIEAETIDVMHKGSWKQTWSAEEERYLKYGRP
jgi:hypothetical protein